MKNQNLLRTVAALVMAFHVTANAQARGTANDDIDSTTSGAVPSAERVELPPPFTPVPENVPDSLAPNPSLALPLDLTPATNLNSFQLAKQEWYKWQAKRALVCEPALDSMAYFNPFSDKVAIVIHGLGSSPRGMIDVINLLRDQGFTVLAPRLAGHFDQNLRALDDTEASAWIDDSEQVFRIAKMFGPRITVVGHSLGGLLASRLAIEYPDQIEHAILFAPAWRVKPLVQIASGFGALFDLNLNDTMEIPIGCNLKQGYIPAVAGQRVNDLVKKTEADFGGNYNDPRPFASIFSRMAVPRILFTSHDDEAVDGGELTSMCPAMKTGCLEIPIPGAKHMGIARNLSAKSEGKFKNSSIKSIIKRFTSLDGRVKATATRN